MPTINSHVVTYLLKFVHCVVVSMSNAPIGNELVYIRRKRLNRLTKKKTQTKKTKFIKSFSLSVF